jgi:DNA (cytosine-5)-methyltransferase 1
MGNPRVVDLFAGAGGMSLGFAQAGFEIVHALDAWPAAVDTYRANLGNHVHLGGIAAAL